MDGVPGIALGITYAVAAAAGLFAAVYLAMDSYRAGRWLWRKAQGGGRPRRRVKRI